MKLTPLRRSFYKKICILAALILCLPCFAVPSEAADFAVTSPWVSFIAEFIVGDKGGVRPLSVWTPSGYPSAVGRPRASEFVIALDEKDAARFRVPKNSKKLCLLYKTMPMTEAEFIRGFFDPATLPFIAQNIMKAVSSADPKRYAFYQRRLAEFQSRIDSTQEIGSYLITKQNILDLTGAEGYWVRSAVRSTVRPPDSVWKSWLAGDAKALKAACDEAARRKWLILLDVWTPPQIRAIAVNYENRLTLSPPVGGQDYFVFLHNIFLAINDKAKKGVK